MVSHYERTRRKPASPRARGAASATAGHERQRRESPTGIASIWEQPEEPAGETRKQSLEDPQAVPENVEVSAAEMKIETCAGAEAELKLIDFGLSHLGRPGGRFDEKLSFKFMAEILFKKLPNVFAVVFMNDCVGDDNEKVLADPPPGTVFILENLRFHAEEEGKGKDADGNKVVPSEQAVKEFRRRLVRADYFSLRVLCCVAALLLAAIAAVRAIQ